jgi:glycosyltransferase involved in cell wall biosynthesis
MITLLTLGLYPSSGGPAKSIRAFSSALDARVISWVDPAERAREPLVWDDTLEVTGSRAPVLRQLQVPAAGTAEAEALIARARLVSVHSFWRWHIPWVHRVCRRHGVPYWYVPHGSLDPYVMQGRDAPIKRIFLAGAGRAFLRDAATVIYSTTREAEKARPMVGHDRAEVMHWPLSADDLRTRDTARRAATRVRLGIPDDAPVFLYLGRLSPMKRPLETIVAFAQAAAPGAHLIVTGNDFGVTADECLAVAAQAGVAERVHVTGPAYGAEKSGLLAAADIYISLSHRENFNFTAAEALAAGLALVLSPGNDLAPDLAALPGVTRLPDDALATAAQAVASSASEGLQALAQGAAARAVWAARQLAPEIFARQLRAAADRHARHAIPAPAGQPRERTR